MTAARIKRKQGDLELILSRAEIASHVIEMLEDEPDDALIRALLSLEVVRYSLAERYYPDEMEARDRRAFGVSDDYRPASAATR
jgi:hypothetical protein